MHLFSQVVRNALVEDGSIDVTSRATCASLLFFVCFSAISPYHSHIAALSSNSVPEGTQGSGHIFAKQHGILAGCTPAHAALLGCDESLIIRWHKADGDSIAPGDALASISGNVRSILAAERTALNFIMRMGGIASATHELQRAASPATILDTRKTACGLRALDKWAVRLGGGTNHRLGLHDMILIKENHITASGGVVNAVRNAQQYQERLDASRRVPAVVEVETMEQLRSVVDEVLDASNQQKPAPVQRVLLDNFTAEELPDAVMECHRGGLQSEASGGVSLTSVRDVAASGVTHISCGSITHSVRALDVSLSLSLTE
jgi:nicotinate-nucleotide pyrophosphorylase (carboxylating)